jgi:protein-S-isoprenylcysteine O-methyltransferase Ste14
MSAASVTAPDGAARHASVEPSGAPNGSVDFGRVAAVALFVLTACSNLTALVVRVLGSQPTWQKAAEVASSGLALSFCALVVRAYLRRGRATATDRQVAVWFVAPLATVVPLAMAAVPSRPGGPVRTVVELALTIAGLSFSVWAVRCLASNLSIVPQARSAICHGPYRLVRHPLYLGELVALSGLALHVGRWEAGVVLVVEVLLQVYRAGREERLLLRVVPGYAEYAARTRRLVPWVW